MDEKWYLLGKRDDFRCLNCNQRIYITELIQTEDSKCALCEAPSFFYGISKNAILQVLVDKAPKPFDQFKNWFQTDLTPREFLYLVGIFQNIGKDVTTVQNEINNEQ